MEEPLELDTIVEVREELMVSSSGGNPTLRIAHFLKPTITSIKGPVFKLPPPILEPQKLSLRVSFRGWRCAQNNWKTWVDKMASLHQATWKRAGIYEAVLNSTYQIRRDNDLVFGFAKRWCSETNTFIFPWGEATITLEDIMVLGAYSVLGDSVLCPVESKELKEIENNLKEMRIEICRTKARKASQTLWLKKFMDSGNEFEHEAFLSFWLCRYVLQNSSETIREYVFSIAIHLARGRKIALAPAVLASIYKDLSLLKEKIVDSHKSEADNDDDDDDDDDEDGVLELKIFSPFHLVQIWAWERFLELRPNPNLINYGDPRMARWDQVKGSEIEIVSLALDSAGESFQWRPYAMGDCNFPKFYAEKEMFVSVGPGLDEELQSFGRCLRVSELVGLGCIEQYLPHRVAMQFGVDQDLPGCVDRLNETSEIAWNHYSKPKHNMKLYVPSRLFEADVTVKYLEWWKQSIRSQQDASKGAVLQQREPRDSKGKEGTNKDYIPAKSSKKPHKKSKGKRKANDLHVTPGFSSKFNRMGMGNCNEEDGLTIAERMKFTDKHKNFVNGQGPQGGEAVNSFCQFEILSSSSSSSSSDNGPVINLGKKDVAKGVTECQGDSNISKQSSKTSKGRMIDNTASIPPSFPPKCKIVEVGDSDEEDKLTVKEQLRSCNITNGVGNKMSGNGKPLSGAKSHDLSSSTADNGEVRKIESLVEPVGNVMQGEVVIGNAEGSMEDANASKEGSEAFTIESINGFEGARSSSSTFGIPGLELEARISKLEKVVAQLKAARFGNKFEKNPTKEGLSGL